MNNFWESDDFSVISMTQSINDIYVPPARLGQLGIFASSGISTTVVGIEKTANELRLIPTAARGAMPTYKRNETRNMRAIPVPHLPKNDEVVADSIQNVRAFGQESALESFAAVVAQRLAMLKADHELTWEYHRIGALQGKVMDADGTSVVYDLHSEFGVARQSIEWDRSDLTDLRVTVAAGLEDAMNDALFGTSYSGIMAMCSPEFWTKLISSTEVGDAYKQFQSSKFWQGEQTNQPFQFAGISWERLRGKAGSVPFIPAGEAFAFPLGTSGVFEQLNAPAPFEETVNTLGLPYYARQEPMKFGAGREIHTNSNPLFLCKRPACLVKLTIKAGT